MGGGAGIVLALCPRQAKLCSTAHRRTRRWAVLRGLEPPSFGLGTRSNFSQVTLTYEPKRRAAFCEHVQAKYTESLRAISSPQNIISTMRILLVGRLTSAHPHQNVSVDANPWSSGEWSIRTQFGRVGTAHVDTDLPRRATTAGEPVERPNPLGVRGGGKQN